MSAVQSVIDFLDSAAEALREAPNPSIFTTRALPSGRCCTIADRHFIHPDQIAALASDVPGRNCGLGLMQYAGVTLRDADKLAADLFLPDPGPQQGLLRRKRLQAYKDVLAIADRFGTDFWAVLQLAMQGAEGQDG